MNLRLVTVAALLTLSTFPLALAAGGDGASLGQGALPGQGALQGQGALPGSRALPGQGAWLAKVPATARSRPNPLAADPDAPLAGAKLFRHDCASCHGSDALGRGPHPSLRSERVRNATDGELEWLLTNGSMGHGMPSWSRLPEAERWQLIKYLRSLPLL